MVSSFLYLPPGTCRKVLVPACLVSHAPAAARVATQLAALPVPAARDRPSIQATPVLAHRDSPILIYRLLLLLLRNSTV